MRLLIELCLLVVLAGGSLGQGYYSYKYPRPGCSEYEWVCDPDNLLSHTEALMLDAKLSRVVSDTKCPCSNYACKHSGSRGYKVAVALITSFSPDSRKDDQNAASHREPSREQMAKTLEEAKKIAVDLRKTWSFGRCDEDVVVIYSRDDDVVYTVTGSVARKKLDDGQVADISVQARKSNFKNFASTGIGFIVDRYRAAFLGNSLPTPKAITSGSSFVRPGLLMSVLLTGLLLA